MNLKSNINTFRFYIFILGILLIVMMLSACTRSNQKHRILVIHSYEKEYTAYPDFNRMIVKEFKHNNISADIRTIYIDCHSYIEDLERDWLNRQLDSLGEWKPEVILVNDDQACYTLLTSEKPLVCETPIVFAGVNYPNWPLIKKFPNVTGFCDSPDYITNLKVIEEILNGKALVYMFLDSTFLDRKIRTDLHQQMNSIGLTIMEPDSRQIDQVNMTLNDKINERTKKEKMEVQIRRIRNADYGSEGIIWNLSRFSAKRHYLQSKRDPITIKISKLADNASFSAINEAVGYDEDLLGGYFTPMHIQVTDQVMAAVSILKGTSPADIPIRESEKAYVIDWKVFKLLGLKNPETLDKYEIMNISFYEKHPVLSVLSASFILLIILSLFAWLIFIYKRETNRKKLVLRELKKEKESLALAIEGSNTYAWHLEDEQIFIVDDFWEVLNLTPRSLTIDEFVSHIHPAQRKNFENNRYLLHQPGKRTVKYQFSFNGEPYQWWELRYSLVSGSDKQELAGLLLNIQEFKDREQELIEARKMAEKAELKESFLANMSHEIRTPLNAIVGFSNILITDNELAEQDKIEYMGLVNKNSTLLLKLIGDILELSRIESGNMSFQLEQCTVARLIEDIYRTHQILIPKSLEFIKEVSDNTAVKIETDILRLTQVITNFLNNAAKFTSNGYIKLGFTYNESCNEVSIYVEDTGSGICQQEQKMIFNRFYKQNEFEQGTGLGLSICQVIADKLDGRIELCSEPGKGSRFTIIIPCL